MLRKLRELARFILRGKGSQDLPTEELGGQGRVGGRQGDAGAEWGLSETEFTLGPEFSWGW